MSQCFSISIPTCDIPAKIMARYDNEPQIAKIFLWCCTVAVSILSLKLFKRPCWSKNKHPKISAYQTHLRDLAFTSKRWKQPWKQFFTAETLSLNVISHHCYGQTHVQMVSTWVSSVPFRVTQATTTWAAPARVQPACQGKWSCLNLEQLCARRWKVKTKISSFVPTTLRLHLSATLQVRTLGTREVHITFVCLEARACIPPQHHTPWSHSCFLCLPFLAAHVHFSTVDFFSCFNCFLPPYLYHNPENWYSFSSTLPTTKNPNTTIWS